MSIFYDRSADEYAISRIRKLRSLTGMPSTAVIARQTSTAPPSPRVASTLAAANTGYTFSYYEVAGTYGYNIYRSTANDPNTADKIDFVAASVQVNPSRTIYTPDGVEPEVSQATQRTYTDNPGVTSYYWVAPVNQAGNEGTRIAMQGATVPTPGTGSGIQSLNTLSSSSQTFAVGTSGTDFAISSAGSTHTFNLPSASAANRGAVTTAAQTFAGDKTFNGNIGFYGTSAVAKVTVTGSRGGNAALADLLTKLASTGMLTDSTTA
jgi:hypothetical protein